MDKRLEAQVEAKALNDLLAGHMYRHFKGGIYYVMCVSVHSETAEPMVVYHSADDPKKVWVRPAKMFMSMVDKQKYPAVTQEMRFERLC